MVTASTLIAQNLPFTLTGHQQQLLEALDGFLLDHSTPKHTFLIKGFAGTGKSTIIGQLVKIVGQLGYKVALLAPTGRAAKVIAQYSQKRTYTIHRKIYRQVDIQQGKLVFNRVNNTSKKTLFIVDEASMLAHQTEFGRKSVLHDLVEYVFEKEFQKNKLVLVGDVAQLPPVGETLSKALDEEYLKSEFGLNLVCQELSEVTRQAQDSGILWNATHLREVMQQKAFTIALKTKGYPDFYRMGSERLEDGLRYAYDKYGFEETIVLCRSNKNANQFNNYIRKMIRFTDEEVEAGDYLMIAKNNYFVLDNNKKGGFLANGDFVEVLRIRHSEEVCGLRFATMQLRLIEGGQQEEEVSFEAKVVLDTLHLPYPALPVERYQEFYKELSQSYGDISQKRKRNEALKEDPYLNALQVKYAYALTCHKAQGGQWNAVFIEQGYMADPTVDLEFLRWLYTALTRGVKEVFLINFRPDFFSA